jgi:ubiquinone biosynthesis UbiH/UbiF/VisC/COQ6 family hydroxylase
MQYAPASGTPAVSDVIVVGRGANGCAAALGLAQAGLRVTLVGPEPPPEPSDWDPRIYALSPASRALLERLRVWPALDTTRMAGIQRMRVFPDSRPDAPELGFSAHEAGVPALAWVLEGRQLTRALHQAVGFSGLTLRAAQVLQARTSPQAAEVELDDGTCLRARLLVAADGAGSPVRAMLGIPVSERAYPQRAVVANFACARGHADQAWQWFGDHGVLALLPLPGDRCSIVWSAPEPLADELLSLSSEGFALRVAEAAQGVVGALCPLGPAQAFPLRLIRAERMVVPRALLLGDAAHAVHPLAGQGLNLGFGDVTELLSVIAGREPFRDLGDHLLLRRYERARREPVLAMAFATDGLQRLFDAGSAASLPAALQPLRALRETGWRLVAGTPWLRRRLIRHAVS